MDANLRQELAELSREITEMRVDTLTPTSQTTMLILHRMLHLIEHLATRVMHLEQRLSGEREPPDITRRMRP